MTKAWINQIFRSGMVNKGGMVRRSVPSVALHASETELLDEVRARGFHMIRQGDQYIIFCDPNANTTFMC